MGWLPGQFSDGTPHCLPSDPHAAPVQLAAQAPFADVSSWQKPVHLPPQGGKDIATKPVAYSNSPLQINVGLPSVDGLLDKVPLRKVFTCDGRSCGLTGMQYREM